MERQQLLTTAQVAEMLNVSRACIYNARYRKDGPPAYRLGNSLRWKLEDVEAWLATRYEAPKGA